MCELAKCPMVDEKEYRCEECVHNVKDQWWIFTFGGGQKYAGRYVKIKGTFDSARQKMIDRYGLEWGFQYSEEDWENWKTNPKRFWPMETELEVIE